LSCHAPAGTRLSRLCDAQRGPSGHGPGPDQRQVRRGGFTLNAPCRPNRPGPEFTLRCALARSGGQGVGGSSRVGQIETFSRPAETRMKGGPDFYAFVHICPLLDGNPCGRTRRTGAKAGGTALVGHPGSPTLGRPVLTEVMPVATAHPTKQRSRAIDVAEEEGDHPRRERPLRHVTTPTATRIPAGCCRDPGRR
jgi:hypothetical protein